MKILLIAGHGNGDPGACARIGGTAYRECDETRRMVTMLAQRLEKAGVSVTVYNMDYNAYEDWKSGSLLSRAKFKDADYVFEVHFNAFDGTARGVECYVTTKEASTGVEEAVVRSIAALGFANRGVKKKNYSVIAAAKGQGTSSALLEICFIDSYSDMTLYVKSREKVADAVAAGICEGFGLAKTEQTTDESLEDAPAEWAKDAWEAARAGGIMDGTRPKDIVTRQELAVVLHRLGMV